MWRAVEELDSTFFSSRAKRAFVQLEQLLGAFPLLDPEEENLQEQLAAIRVRFRALGATLGVRLEYPGQPHARGSSHDADF